MPHSWAMNISRVLALPRNCAPGKEFQLHTFLQSPVCHSPPDVVQGFGGTGKMGSLRTMFIVLCHPTAAVTNDPQTQASFSDLQKHKLIFLLFWLSEV